MDTTDQRTSLVRGHPFLTVYLIVLGAVWAISALTWTVAANGSLELHPGAQALQYVLVVLAATLAALRLRVEPRQTQDDAQFGFYDLRWSISSDVGSRTFWAAIAVGAGAMIVNVGLLTVADVLAGAGAGLGTYVEWAGSGLAAGAVLGMFSALLAIPIAAIYRLARARGNDGA